MDSWKPKKAEQTGEQRTPIKGGFYGRKPDAKEFSKKARRNSEKEFLRRVTSGEVDPDEYDDTLIQ